MNATQKQLAQDLLRALGAADGTDAAAPAPIPVPLPSTPYRATVQSVGQVSQVVVAPQTRSGIKTTEFWLALVVTIAGTVAANYSTQPWAQTIGAISATLTSVGYGFVRASVKKSA